VEKKPFLRKSFQTLLFLTCIPTLLIGILVYVFGTSEIEREFNRIHINQLRQAAEEIDRDLNSLELYSSQWTFNPIFEESLKADDLETGFELVQNLYQTLTSMKGSNPMIAEIYVYNKSSGMMLSNLQGARRLSAEEEAKLEHEVLNQKRDLYWLTTDDETPDLFSHSRHMLIFQAPAGNQQRLGAIFLTLDEKRLEQLVSIFQWTADSPVMLLNEQGTLISNGKNESGVFTDLEAALRERAKSMPGMNGSFMTDWKQESYSVSYSRFSRLGETWTFITATPISRLTAPVVTLSRIIIGIGLTALLLSFIISWMASRHLYRPVHKLVENLKDSFRPSELEAAGGKDEFDWLEQQWTYVTRESKLLQRRLEESLPLQREGFFLQLVQGHLYSLKEAELRHRMEMLGCALDQVSFHVAVFYLHGFSSISDRFSDGDEPLVTFAAANIIQETAQGEYEQSHVINFQDLLVGLIVLIPSGKEQRARTRAHVLALVQETMEALTQTLRLEVTVSLGKSTERADCIAEVMEEAQYALRYRNMKETQQILDMEEWMNQGEGQFEYPFDEDKAILHAFKMGLEEETVEALERFMLCLQQQALHQLHLQQGMNQLLGNMHNAVMQSGYDPSELYGGANHYVELSQMNDPDKIKKWFVQSVIQPYIHEYLSSRQLHLKQLADKVTQYMEGHYRNDISVEMCAEWLGTYPKKVNQALKLTTSMTFIDYLTYLRMEKAKCLLVETEEKINDIAEQVGYQPSYFNRLFKRMVGITPGRYREQNQES
jgi:AraC-like DNA-binding protein